MQIASRLKYLLLIIYVFALGGWLQAATPHSDSLRKHSIKGTISDLTDGSGLPFAHIYLPNSGLWTIADENGQYKLSGIPTGKHLIKISLLGYKSISLDCNINDLTGPLNFSLQEENLQLEGIVVTAQQGGSLNSSSRIEKTAIEHVQPSSLGDVMQLLPGHITQNPKLNKVNNITIRDTKSGDNVNAMGTAIIMDGAGLSNNSNLQFEKVSTTYNSDSYYGSSAASGIDTRQIPTDNIESIEVIRGVASAEYGDLTSGAVIIKTKTGYTPWNIRLKTDPATKQVAVGKGFMLNNKKGTLNFDTDYLVSYADPRSTSEAYTRYTLQLGYANTFFNNSGSPLQLDVKLRGNYSDMSNESDADRFLDEFQLAVDQSLRLTSNGTWMLNKPWITNLSFTLSGSYGEQFSRNKAYQGSYSGARFTNMLNTGESIGYIIPDGGYYSDVTVDGTPYDIQAKINGTWIYNGQWINNKFFIGGEWRTEGNNGNGKSADPLKPENPTGSPLRNRSYKSIPAMNRYSLFAEEKITLPIASTQLELQAGLRLTNIQPSGLFDTDFSFNWEPRLNARYRLLNHQGGFKNLSLRGGWGILCKMPTLMYLYPDPVYLDKSSYAYNDPANSYTLSVFSTRKLNNFSNPDLQTPTSTNMEIGIDFDWGPVNGSIVYFNEHLRNGFSFQHSYIPYTYRQYTSGQPSGSFPIYENGEVSVGGNPVGYTLDTVFMAYNRPANGNNYDKWGIEYTFGIANIRAINTSIDINGAYLHIKHFNSNLTADHPAKITKNKEYAYTGIYGGATTVSNGSIDERMNITARFITHIPALRLVVTLTAECVLIDRTQTLSEYNGAVMAYYYDEQGKKITGPQVYADDTHLKYVNPLYIMDMHGQTYPFTEAMEKNSKYAELIARNNYANIFTPRSYPFYGLLNLRVSKDFGKWATVAFYANNFLNIAGRVKDPIRQVYSNKNIPIYFGAEIKFNL